MVEDDEGCRCLCVNAAPGNPVQLRHSFSKNDGAVDQQTIPNTILNAISHSDQKQARHNTQTALFRTSRSRSCCPRQPSTPSPQKAAAVLDGNRNMSSGSFSILAPAVKAVSIEEGARGSPAYLSHVSSSSCTQSISWNVPAPGSNNDRS